MSQNCGSYSFTSESLPHQLGHLEGDDLDTLYDMALFKFSSFNFLKRSTSRVSSGAAKGAPSIAKPATASGIPSQPKSLAALEQEIEEEQRLLALSKKSVKTSKIANRRSPIKTMTAAGLLLAIPIGAIYLVNLPYPAIRRPIAAKAPLLLLPSYISLDRHYRLAIDKSEQAQQLIDNATTYEDLALGEQKVDQAQKSLDALPIGWVDSSPMAYSFYDWRFSPSRFNATRAEVGRLKAKVFQEKNAQSELSVAEQSIVTAKQQYSEIKNRNERQEAIVLWKTALAQLQKIPDETLAGRTAQQSLPNYQQDFEETVDLVAVGERTSAALSNAREYSQRAAAQGQNPPHSAEEWQQIIGLWEEAIAQLGNVPKDDLLGNSEAQSLRATYQQNLGQIKVRLAAETDSVRAFEEAQAQTVALLGMTSRITREDTRSRLQSIVNKLSQVKPGTTVYLEAQANLLSAQNKLSQIKP